MKKLTRNQKSYIINGMEAAVRNSNDRNRQGDLIRYRYMAGVFSTLIGLDIQFPREWSKTLITGQWPPPPEE